MFMCHVICGTSKEIEPQIYKLKTRKGGIESKSLECGQSPAHSDPIRGMYGQAQEIDLEPIQIDQSTPSWIWHD